MRRPRSWRTAPVACVSALALLGCGGDDVPGADGAGPPASSAQTVAPSAAAAGVRPAVPGTGPKVLSHPVIVDLAVTWRPEQQQSGEQARLQRERIQDAQDRVLRALGPHGRLRRPLHETAQVALVVDEEGLALLRRHPLVAVVHQDLSDSAS